MRTGYIVAGVAALALALVTAGVDWYQTAQGKEARRIEEITDNPSGAQSGEIDRRLNESAKEVGDRETDKAWEADALIDRIILVMIIGTIVLAILTWFTRSLGGRPTPKGLGPAGLCAILATVTAILVAYRMIQEPGLDEGTEVKIGPLIALLLLGAIALGSASGLRADDNVPEEEEVEDAGAA